MASEVLQNRSRLEQRQRTVLGVVIDDRRHLVVRADRQELGLELVALVDVDWDHRVRKAALLEHDGDLLAIAAGPKIDVNHGNGLLQVAMMDRILEPEIMDGQAEADAYARADFSDSNAAFVRQLIEHYPTHLHAVVDLGCGPADIPLRLAHAVRATRITAVDGSAAMLELAHRALAAAALLDRVTLCLGRIPDVNLPPHAFDAVLSKDMLHHLPDPQVLWQEAGRLGRAGAAVFVMDLVRPDSPLEAREIVERVAGREHPILKEDFYNSLCAAFTVPEVQAQLRAAGLPLHVQQVSDRHMTIRGLLPVTSE
jgi:SAM-dependent methyltransferase